MVYIGDTPRTTSFASVVKDEFSGDGSTTAFTLSKVATTNSVSVFVENVRQEPTTAYAVSGTTLTFTAAPVTSSGNNIYVLHMNPTTTTTHPSAQNLTAVNGTFTGNIDVDGTANLDVVDIDAKTTITAADGIADNDYVVEIQNAEATDGRSYGVRIKAGSTSADQSFVIQDHDASNTLFKITGDGDVNVGIGDILFGTAGKGINLGVTSNTDANTLDDYEEGTFTFGSNANIGFVSNSNVGRYTKIGNMVHVQLYVDISSVSSTNHFYLSGMPFTAGANTTNTYNGYSTGTVMFYNTNTYWSGSQFNSQIGNGSSNMYFYESYDNNNWSIVTNSRILSSTEMIISHTYFV